MTKHTCETCEWRNRDNIFDEDLCDEGDVTCCTHAADRTGGVSIQLHWSCPNHSAHERQRRIDETARAVLVVHLSNQNMLKEVTKSVGDDTEAFWDVLVDGAFHAAEALEAERERRTK